MDKAVILRQIKEWIDQGSVSREEVVLLLGGGGVPLGGAGSAPSPASAGASLFTHKIGIAELLYFIGGLIVFIGIGVLVAENWQSLNDFTKIAVTLGSALAAFAAGVLLGNAGDNYQKIGQAFSALAGFLLPVGLAITFDILGVVSYNDAATQSLISGISLAVFGLSFFLFRRDVYTIFTIAFATWFYFALTGYLIGGAPLFSDSLRFYEYRALLAGLAYLALGYFFQQHKKPLADWLYAFGALAVLASAFALGSQELVWELLFPGIVFGFILLSIYVKSRAFLILGTLFLMAYIMKITSEYFSQSLGWPTALIIAGLLLMAVGFSAFRFGKTYLKPVV
jgi:hypothetical protein